VNRDEQAAVVGSFLEFGERRRVVAHLHRQVFQRHNLRCGDFDARKRSDLFRSRSTDLVVRWKSLQG
jgi:hypothetical protein